MELKPTRRTCDVASPLVIDCAPDPMKTRRAPSRHRRDYVGMQGPLSYMTAARKITSTPSAPLLAIVSVAALVMRPAVSRGLIGVVIHAFSNRVSGFIARSSHDPSLVFASG